MTNLYSQFGNPLNDNNRVQVNSNLITTRAAPKESLFSRQNQPNIQNNIQNQSNNTNIRGLNFEKLENTLALGKIFNSNFLKIMSR